MSKANKENNTSGHMQLDLTYDEVNLLRECMRVFAKIGGLNKITYFASITGRCTFVHQDSRCTCRFSQLATLLS